MYEMIYKDVIPSLLGYKIQSLEEIPPLVKMSKELNWGYFEAEKYLLEYYDRMKRYIEQEFTDGSAAAPAT